MAGYNYRVLISEKQFLQVKRRAMKLSGTDVVEILYDKCDLIFKSRSGTYPNLYWYQTIRILDLNTLSKLGELTKQKDLNKVIRDSGVKVYCNCVSEGTDILTKEGYKPIESLKSGDIIVCSDGTEQPLIRLLKNESKKEFVRIKIKGEIEDLVLSKDHKVLVSTYRNKCACGCGKDLRILSEKVAKQQSHSLFERRLFLSKHSKRPIADNFNRIQWKCVGDLLPGDMLLSPVIEGNKDFNKDLAWALGVYAAEGHIQGNQVYITLNQNEKDTVAKELVRIFQNRGEKIKTELKSYGNQKWLSVKISSKEYRDLCVNFCGRGSKTKFINPLMLEWKSSAKEAFLVGHLLGDGSVDDSFRFLSSSKNLINGIKLLLNSIGIDACNSFAHKKRQKESDLYQSGVTLNDFYQIYEKYKHLFRDKDIVFKNKSCGKNVRVANYICRTITSVSDEVVSSSYDLSLVEEPHDYIANGVIVSNCPAFLYWGFMYMAWKKGYGLKKELRVPRVRNPLQRGYVCFPKGSQVLTYYGYKPIESISNGDILFTHSSRLKKVLSTFSSMTVSLVRIKAEGTEFEATIDHKFPVLVNGQVIWKTALSLNPDSDYLISPVLCEFDKDYPVNSYPFSINFQATFPYKVRARKVLSKVVYSTYESVYNLEVEEDNTYIVNGVATSNCKHLYQCLIIYPFIASTVARKFKEYYAKLEERNNRARGLNNPNSTPQNN